MSAPRPLRSTRDGLLTALGIFLGLFWGYAFQQTGNAGTAVLRLQASNATSPLAGWVSQSQTSLILVLRATAAQAILFVALLLIQRIPTRPVRYRHVPELFPLATILAWFALILSAMAAATPQAFLSIRSICGPSNPEVKFALGQIFTFLEFSRAYVDVAGVLSMFTGIWLAAVINTGPFYNRRGFIRLFTAVVVPLLVFFADVITIPLISPLSEPCVSIGGTGAVESLPSWWSFVAAPILVFFMALGVLVVWKPKSHQGRPSSVSLRT